MSKELIIYNHWRRGTHRWSLQWEYSLSWIEVTERHYCHFQQHNLGSEELKFFEIGSVEDKKKSGTFTWTREKLNLIVIRRCNKNKNALRIDRVMSEREITHGPVMIDWVEREESIQGVFSKPRQIGLTSYRTDQQPK